MTTWALTKLVIAAYWFSVWMAVTVVITVGWAIFRNWEKKQIAKRRKDGYTD